jgi:alpha-tubulin suppressor-like RCC1 family protein
MRSPSRILFAFAAALIASGIAACGDATRALSPDHAAPVEQQDQGKGLQVALRGELHTYPQHVIADFVTELSAPNSEAAKGLSYEWVFGDGKRASGAKVSHVFADTGRQAVTLRVTNVDGQVGVITQTLQISASISQLGTVMKGIVPGGIHTCAIDALSSLYCWGTNGNGTVGDGTTVDHLAPVLVAGSVSFTQIATGTAHNCALSDVGDAYCWGRNYAGQLGDGTTTDRTLPTLVLGGLTFTSIDVGFNHSCAITEAGVAYCWGGDDLGQLGDGAPAANRTSPSAVSGGHNFSVIRAGSKHTCALETSTGFAYCWGANGLGQIGNGGGGVTDSDMVKVPKAVNGARAYTQLDAGASHNCAISGSYTYCWGWNGYGQLGVTTTATCAGSRPCAKAPKRLPASLVLSAVGLGTSHSCGLKGSTGTVYCWGNNTHGQLGDGTTTSESTPVTLSGITLKSIRGGNSFTCGVGVDNNAYCWGINIFGALGTGDTTSRLTPTLLAGLTF